MIKKFIPLIKSIINPILLTLCGRELYDKIHFFRGNSYWPNFKKPKTFSEKICVYKLYNAPKNAHILCDKWAAREYVKQLVGAEILNEIYYVGNEPEKIDWDKLPKSFVAKGTQGSGSDFNILVEDKEKISKEAFIQKTKKILKLSFGKYSNEPWYQMIKPQIIIEKWLKDKNSYVAPDYKFFVFHGKVQFISVIKGRFVEKLCSIYNRNWERQAFAIDSKIGPEVPRPENLEKMVHIAETLAQGYEFLRIDLYNVDGNKIIFGEITVCSSAGWKPFNPDKSYDAYMGSFW